MLYTLKFNRNTVHIDGAAIRTQGGEFDYSQNACGAITRGRFQAGKQAENATEIYAAAQANAKAMNRKLCKNCEAAIVAEIEAAQVTETPATETSKVYLEMVQDRPMWTIAGLPMHFTSKDRAQRHLNQV